MQALSVYTTWVGAIGRRESGPMVLLVRRLGWRLFVNFLLTVGAFAIGSWISEWDIAYLPAALRSTDIHESLVWTGVMVVTAPLYLASFRMVKAIGGLIAEICVPTSAGGDSVTAVRLVIAQVVVLVSLVVMTFITILLSTSILSSLESMVLLLLIVTIAASIFRSILLRVYSRAEIALHETLIELPLLRPEEIKPMPELLREAELETVEIPSGSAMVERKLREIPLRTQTGASIVAIERAGQRLINPGPDEVLRPGDNVLLLGQAEQLPNARILLVGAGTE
jgi:CPA2 family monovalent cation:H+ antiporter-2